MLLSKFKGFGIGIVITCCFTNNAVAQIKPDTKLLINSNITELQNVSVIFGGIQVRSNLCDSFEELSIIKEQTANFVNYTNIQNIISRVTGKQASNIDVTISANSATNLFFINPNSILIGKNASLDIGGSFLRSFDKLLEKYDVLDKVKLKFQFTVNVHTDELSDVKEIIDQEFVSQTCGFCIPCPSNSRLWGCIGCC